MTTPTMSRLVCAQAEFDLLFERTLKPSPYYTYNWVAVTLNLKQALSRNNGTLQPLTLAEVKKAIKRLMKVLNTAVYGKANRRYAKRLCVLPVIERGSNGRLHIHMLLQSRNLEFMDAGTFRALIEKTWAAYPWGHGQLHIAELQTRDNVERWTRYILKDVLKCVEDVVDYDNMLLPDERDEVLNRKFRGYPAKRKPGNTSTARPLRKKPPVVQQKPITSETQSLADFMQD